MKKCIDCTNYIDNVDEEIFYQMEDDGTACRAHDGLCTPEEEENDACPDFTKTKY